MTSKLLKPLALPCLILAFTLLSVNLFIHLSYPLLWNDEAETAMFASRVLRFGYPKIDDGHNYLYQLIHPDTTLGIHQSTNAYIGTTWGHFYFAAIGHALTRLATNPYTQTFLLRLPFAVIGLFGLIILIRPYSRFFPHRPTFHLYTAAFFTLAAISIPLILHLREVRYYSLIIFLYALFHTLHLFPRAPSRLHYLSLTAILLATFFTFYPAFFVLSLTLTLHTFIHHHASLSKLHSHLYPLILSLPFIIPGIIFFDTFHIASILSAHYQFNLSTYLSHLYHSLYFLLRYDYLALALLAKLSLLHLLLTRPPLTSRSRHLLSIISFQTLLILTHLLLTARTPFFYERYSVLISPMILISIFTDLLFLRLHHSRSQFTSRLQLISVLTLLLTLSRSDLLTARLTELTTPYQGPIDATVSYIHTYFPNPSSLTIATNFEEFSLMYYLGSRITIGYAQANLAHDLTLQPDIIIIRSGTGPNYNLSPLTHFLDQADYTPIHLPIADYPVNNNPGLYTSTPHLFQTKLTPNPQDQLILHLRSDLLPPHL